MSNYTTKEMVSKVWDFIQNIPTTEGNIAIAGGMIADAYFNKPFSDIDVFVAAQDSDRLVKFCEYYGFKEFIVPDRFRTEFDSYGNAHKVRIGKQDSDILSVYKGEFLGHPIDFVLVDNISVVHHVETLFDQSIKSCWFNGEYNYSDYFKMSIDMNEVFPIRQEAGAYARAWLSANKYGLGLSNNYELSKHYTAYAYNHGEVDGILSEATINKIEHSTEKMFNFEIDMANVILMDVFLRHMPENDEVYSKLSRIATEDVVANHPLHGQDVSITLEDPTYIDFKNNIRAVLSCGLLDEHSELDIVLEAKEAVKQFMNITSEEYAKGIMKDNSGRDVRIGRYFNKVRRQHKQLFDNYGSTYADEAMKLLEKRGTETKAKVFITGSRYALTHISTGTEWTTSCQRWGGFQSCTKQNYGLLANVSGNTLVAYIADERSDNDSSKWKARFLIRIGQDNTLYIERPYTVRTEYMEDKGSRQSLQKALQKLGYTVCITQEEALDFKSLPMIASPYNDNSTDLTVVKLKSGYSIFKGNRQLYELDKLRKAAQEVVNTFVHTIDIRTLNYTPGHYETMVAYVPFPEEHNDLVLQAINETFIGVNRAIDYTSLQLDEVDGKAHIKVIIYANTTHIMSSAKKEAEEAGVEVNFPEYDMWGNLIDDDRIVITDHGIDDLPF